MKTQSQIFNEILAGNPQTIKDLYHQGFPQVKNMILKNSGELEDAEDVFQESLVVLYRKMKQSDFNLTCTITTYLYSVSRNIWLDRLRRKGKQNFTVLDSEEIVDLSNNTLEVIEKNEKYSLFHKHFLKLTADCKKLLNLFFEGLRMSKITTEMGYSSDQYTRKRKFNCKDRLIKNIQADPAFSEISEGNKNEGNTIN